jgi:hypothetical protein
MISTNPISRNAGSAIRNNHDPDENATEKSDLHSEKHAIPKTSAYAGIIAI